MFAQRAFGTRIPCAWPVRGTVAVLDWLMSDPAVLAEAGADCIWVRFVCAVSALSSMDYPPFDVLNLIRLASGLDRQPLVGADLDVSQRRIRAALRSRCAAYKEVASSPDTLDREAHAAIAGITLVLRSAPWPIPDAAPSLHNILQSSER